MAFTDLGSLGAIGNTSNNQTTLDLVTSAAIAAGDFVVVVAAADNIANGGDDNAVTGVTLGVGGQALTKGVQIANALAAQAGASCSIWYDTASSGLASGGTIRATFGSATLVDASAMTARKFSISAGSTVAVEGTAGTLVSNTAADPASLNVTTASRPCLRVRGIASQVGNNTNLTPSATWTAWANGNSATSGTTGEICARAEHLVSAATGAASDPTYVSAIYASAYVAFREVRVLAANGSSYLLTGAATTVVLLKHKIDATAASYALSGTDAAITRFVPPKLLDAEGGGYLVTGAAITAVLLKRKLDATPPGLYALTGATTAAVLFKRKLDATMAAAYALTGADAAITKATSLVNKTLSALGGSYALAGSDAAQRVYRVLAAASGSYQIAGSAVSLPRTQLIALGAAAGSYTLSGNVARLFGGEWPLSGHSVAVAAEQRMAETVAESRTVAAAADNRSVDVLTESRSVAAPTESRTIEVQGESHGVPEMV